MPQNIPIRLVHSDGNLTEIMATSVALDIERKVGGISMPGGGGSRIGFDMNRSSASIIIEGIISDDDIISTYSSAVASSGTIDFSVSHNSADTIEETGYQSWIPSNGVASDITLNNGVRVTGSTTENAKIYLRLTNYLGSTFKIAFVSNAGSVANHFGYDSAQATWYIGIYDSSAGTKGTHAEIADNLFDVINSDPAGMLNTNFVATKETSSFTDEANTKIRITQATKGSKGDNLTPRFQMISLADKRKPLATTFTGGRGASAADSDDYWVQKSAGDKVMDLFGILNNSDNATIASRFKAIGGDSRRKYKGSWKVSGKTGNKYGDYITAIQIPFNSMATAGASEKYSVRNFFMPTGRKHMAWEKGATKSRPATEAFDDVWGDDRDYQGIKGAVQKATFTQLGGEPVFSFTIVFVPVDFIW